MEPAERNEGNLWETVMSLNGVFLLLNDSIRPADELSLLPFAVIGPGPESGKHVFCFVPFMFFSS
jgi:hypothetical protein